MQSQCWGLNSIDVVDGETDSCLEKSGFVPGEDKVIEQGNKTHAMLQHYWTPQQPEDLSDDP